MNDQMMQQAVVQQAAEQGRGGDTVMAHLTLGELVIPKDIVNDPEVAQVLQSVFDAYGVNINEFIVGNQENKINPQTGQPEFFFKKIKSIFKKIAPIALPILGSMIPGVGPIVGAALGGAAGGLVSGGGVKGALTGAALGGVGGALTGGASGLLGHSAGTALDKVSGIAGMQGPTLGSGIKGVLSGGGLASLGAGGATGGLGNISSFVKPAASIFAGIQEDDANEEARKAMLEATGRAESALQPYSQMGLDAQSQLAGNLAEGFNPGDLTADPGYQFRLQQGLDAQQKALAAQGLGSSGQAIKAATEYGQGMAATEYGNAYDRWLEQNRQLGSVGGQGMGAAQALSGIYGDTGNVQAAYGLADAERKNKRIAEILAGLGYK